MKKITELDPITDREISKFRIWYSKTNPNNMLYHVRGIVDNQVIVRYWRPRKRYWDYKCLSFYDLEYWINVGHVYKA